MIEELVGQLNWKTSVLLVTGVLLLWHVSRRIIQSARIRSLGGHAPERRSWLPFGIDMIYDGISHAKRDQNLLFWDKNFSKYGKAANPYTVEASVGTERIVFTADPENIKAILATQFNDYGKGEQFNKDWHDFLGDGIFSTDGQKWHDARQLIRPQFQKDRISDLDTFERHVNHLIPLLGDGSGRQAVDIRDLFFRFTLDAATDFLLGRSVDSIHSQGNTFAEAFNEVQRVQSLIARAGPFNRWVDRRSFYKNLKVMNAFVETFVDDTLRLTEEELAERTKSSEGYTFLHALAGYTRDRKVLRDQLVSILLAGRDTTACTLSWLFYELGRNPEEVAALREEIANTTGFGRPPTYADLKNMKRLQHCLNETLRLYPVVPFNVRLALKDTTLPRGGGPDGNSPIGVLKGTPIGYSTLYMQRTRALYPPTTAAFPDPAVWAPKRWQTWQPKMWTFIPFNGGPRICVGQQFALTEMSYTAVKILQTFSRVETQGLGATKPAMNLSEKAFDGADNAEKKGSLLVSGGDETAAIKRGEVMPMRCDIVLQPAEPTRVAFFRD